MDSSALTHASPNEELVGSAMLGDEPRVRHLLDSGAIESVDWLDGNGFTALMYAASTGHSTIVQLLLDRGAQVETVAENSTTALTLAFARGHAHVVRILVQGGADVLRQHTCGFTAFAAACQAGQTALVIATIEALEAVSATTTIRALLESSGPGGSTPLVLAASYGHLDVVIYLIECNANCLHKNDQGFDAMLGAAERGHSDVVEYLLAFGADADAMNSSGETGLMLASRQGHHDVIDVLLKAGALVNRKDGSGQTALYHCVINCRPTIAARLIHKGANVLIPRSDGCTPFFLACMNGVTAVVKAILEAVADTKDGDTMAAMINASWLDGTSLIVASAQGHTDILQLLITYGVHVHARNTNGEDALLIAVQEGQLAAAMFLLENGANVDSQNDLNRTPLMCASSAGQLDIVRALIKYHACVDLTDADGKSALWLAAQEGAGDVVVVLLDAHADINIQDAMGFTALHVAAANDHEDVVALLVSRQANVHLCDIDRSTALIIAAMYGHARIVRVLLDAGSDASHETYLPLRANAVVLAAYRGHESVVRVLADQTKDNGPITPLMAAANKGHTAICRFLLQRGHAVDLQAIDGRTALHFAVVSRNVETVRALVDAGSNASIQDYNGWTAAHTAAFLGELDIVKLLEKAPGSTSLNGSDICGIWSVSALFEFYGQSNTMLAREDPHWYIDPSAVVESASENQNAQTTARNVEATWLGSKVHVVKVSAGRRAPLSQLEKVTFVSALHRWVPLRHPFLLKLFGACHRGEPFLVVEHANGTLRSYLKEHPTYLWRTLYQVALGLQYLHERGIAHDNLHGDIISFSDSGLPKLGGLAVYADSRSQANWWSPETLADSAVTLEADMYSFGMCIIEAVSGNVPYATEIAAGADVKALIMDGTIPARHEAFSDKAWELVKSLTPVCAAGRMSVDGLVQELEFLGAEEERAVSVSATITIDKLQVRLDDVKKSSIAPTNAFEASLLVQLEEIAVELNKRDDSERRSALLARFLAAEDRFALHLATRSALATAQTYSSGRQHTAILRSLQFELEHLRNDLKLDHSFQSRNWRDSWNESWKDQQVLFCEELIAVSQTPPQNQDDEIRVEQLSCMLFEITKHRNRYGAINPNVTKTATAKIIEILGGPLPDWFFPWYEVALATSKPFSKGGFGEVYRGKWMGSHVVVKKCIAFDQKVFVREVELWFKLDHPHVVKLFGACHVGQKFFVAEWAEHGQLDTYLARNKTLGRSVMWQKLHEAALGLRYLHVRGIIHRDLKCNNILVGRDEKARITDFGLSSPSEQSDDFVVTQTFGNARWAAPEVLAGGMPSYASDVFSSGMCIVEAVTGRVPYAETRDGRVVAASVAAGDFLARPRCFERDGHWMLVTRCCAFDAADRVDLDEMITTLSTFADEERRHTTDVVFGFKSESVVGEPEMILESTNEESMLVSKASQRDSQGALTGGSTSLLTSKSEVAEVDIDPQSSDLFISDASHRESHGLEADHHESSFGGSTLSRIYETSSSIAEAEEDELFSATQFYSAWSRDEKAVDSDASTGSTASV